MSDPIQTTRAALSGIKEAVKVGREIKETATEVNAFLDEEAKARVAWKRKQLGSSSKQQPRQVKL